MCGHIISVYINTMPNPPLAPRPLHYAQLPARHSKAGVISLICAIIAISSIFVSFVGVQIASGSASLIAPDIAGVIFTVSVFVLLLGMVTGIIGILRPRRKRGLAITGFLLNGLVFLLIVGLMVVSKSGLRS